MKVNYALPLVAILLGTAPSMASAGEPCPVALHNVQITPQYTFEYQPDIGFVNVAYTNERDVAATEVVFRLYADGFAVSTIKDKGTFTSGTVIKRTFLDPSESLDEEVSVAEVDFADGTVWTNPGPRSALRQSSDSDLLLTNYTNR